MIIRAKQWLYLSCCCVAIEAINRSELTTASDVSSQWINFPRFNKDATELVWSDEFDVDGAPDPESWGYDTGGWGWGNNELQYHTDRRENSFVKDGLLHIVVRKEQYETNAYTSARLLTKGKREFQYGRIEARIRLPRQFSGLWPAFWMLGANFESVGWPGCGEIDIMEWVYNLNGYGFPQTRGNATRSSAHGPGYSGGNSEHADVYGITDGFHIYALEWTDTELRYLLDDRHFATLTPDPWVFNHPFFIILNVAVGGWGGTVDPSMVFPMEMTVDYVRAYQFPTSYLCK
jgi:beta-glucanase (GH16 family)